MLGGFACREGFVLPNSVCTFRFASVALLVRYAFLPCGRDQTSRNMWTFISNFYPRLVSTKGWYRIDEGFEGSIHLRDAAFDWHDLSNFSICWIRMSHSLIVQNAWGFCVCIENFVLPSAHSGSYVGGRRPYTPLKHSLFRCWSIWALGAQMCCLNVTKNVE